MASRAKQGMDQVGDGPALAAGLCRLGYGRLVVDSALVSRVVLARTGHAMSRQRISALVNSVKITAKTIAVLAAALEVDPGELTGRGG